MTGNRNAGNCNQLRKDKMNKQAPAIADSVTRHNVVSREQVEDAYCKCLALI